MSFKDALCNKSLTLASRIRLFEAVVSPCVLYGCAAWTMNSEREKKLKTARRRMLRWMVGTRRLVDESWVDFIIRATAEAENVAKKYGATCWLLVQRRRKWRFSGQTARRTDGRWSQRLLDWKPWFRCAPRRRVGRPTARWEDCFVQIAGGNWTEAAKDESLWACFEEHFCDP